MHEIKLVQKPIIKHELIKIGTEVAKRIEALNLDAQVATIETVKSLKDLRIELNKELKTYEAQRTVIKKAVNKPYDEFNETYQAEISEKYTSAIDTLKTKIASVEMKVKEDTQKRIKLYFDELCQAHEVDFLDFENVNLSINLSTSDKKHRVACDTYIFKVLDELLLIKTQEFEAEILAEYKVTLNAAKAIKEVKDRKEREAAEIEIKKQREYIVRANNLKSVGMIRNNETKTYNYSDEIYCVWEKVKDLSKTEFSAKLIEFEELIKADIKAKEKPIQTTIETLSPLIKRPVEEAIKNPVVKPPAPLKAPEVVEKLEIVKARFEVTGTFPEIKKLSNWMKENNLTYKNI